MKHIKLVSLPNFDDIVNLRDYFISFDGLRNIENDLTFSVFRKYQCRAGCNICYIKHMWQSDFRSAPEFDPSKVLEFFEYFDTINTHDDLYFLKKSFPEYYQFYKDHGAVFSACSMTDKAFVQQADLVLTELDFKEIYDISFSEEFLLRSVKLRSWVLSKIKELQEKYTIRKLKLIISNPYPSNETLKFLATVRDLGISVDVYDNILNSTNVRHADSTPTNRFDYDGRSYPLLTENLYLQQSSLYSTLPDATLGVNDFYDLGCGFDPIVFLRSVLASKVELYSRYYKYLSSKGVTNKYTDYFSYVSSSLSLSNNFNFIPSIVLNPESRYYKKLVHYGYIDTKYGLLLEKNSHIVPIFTLPRAKQKLSYFPIKALKGN